MRLRTANRRRRLRQWRASGYLARLNREIEAIVSTAVAEVMDGIIGGMFDRIYGPGTAERIQAKAPR